MGCHYFEVTAGSLVFQMIRLLVLVLAQFVKFDVVSWAEAVDYWCLWTLAGSSGKVIWQKYFNFLNEPTSGFEEESVHSYQSNECNGCLETKRLFGESPCCRPHKPAAQPDQCLMSRSKVAVSALDVCWSSSWHKATEVVLCQIWKQRSHCDHPPENTENDSWLFWKVSWRLW